MTPIHRKPFGPNIAMLMPDVQASDEEKYDLVREGVVIFTGALAKHLAKVSYHFL